MFARTGLKPELDRHKAEALWPVIAGRNIAAFTTAVRVRETTMHVYVASAPLKEELGYMKDVSCCGSTATSKARKSPT